MPPHLPILVPPTQGTQGASQVQQVQIGILQPAAPPQQLPDAVVAPPSQTFMKQVGVFTRPDWSPDHLYSEIEAENNFSWLDAYFLETLGRYSHVQGASPEVSDRISLSYSSLALRNHNSPVPGYLGYDRWSFGPGRSIIAIPGTPGGVLPWVGYGLGTMIPNPEYPLVPFDTIYRPILAACQAYWTVLEPKMVDICNQTPDGAVVLTGHSLGGAVASYIQARFNRKYKREGYHYGRVPLVYTFAAPAFSTTYPEKVSTAESRVMRVVEFGDPVPDMVQVAVGTPSILPAYWYGGRNKIPWHTATFSTLIATAASLKDRLASMKSASFFDWSSVMGKMVHQHGYGNYTFQMEKVLSKAEVTDPLYLNLFNANAIMDSYDDS